MAKLYEKNARGLRSPPSAGVWTVSRRRHGEEGQDAQEHHLPQQFLPKATPQSRHSPPPYAAPKLAPNPAIALWNRHSPLVLEPRDRSLSSARTILTVLRSAPPSALRTHSCAPPLPHLPLALLLHHHAPWLLLHQLPPKSLRPTRSGRPFSAPSSSASCARKALSEYFFASVFSIWKRGFLLHCHVGFGTRCTFECRVCVRLLLRG